jgi:hypothetical protein
MTDGPTDWMRDLQIRSWRDRVQYKYSVLRAYSTVLVEYRYHTIPTNPRVSKMAKGDRRMYGHASHHRHGSVLLLFSVPTPDSIVPICPFMAGRDWERNGWVERLSGTKNPLGMNRVSGWRRGGE